VKKLTRDEKLKAKLSGSVYVLSAGDNKLMIVSDILDTMKRDSSPKWNKKIQELINQVSELDNELEKEFNLIIKGLK